MAPPEGAQTLSSPLSGDVITQQIPKIGSSINILKKPEKILLDNTCYVHALSESFVDLGTIRETFFAKMLSVYSQISGNRDDLYAAKKGDFCTRSGLVFEVGGKSKTLRQLKGVENGYLAVGDTLYGEGVRVPLWLFGFLW